MEYGETQPVNPEHEKLRLEHETLKLRLMSDGFTIVILCMTVLASVLSIGSCSKANAKSKREADLDFQERIRACTEKADPQGHPRSVDHCRQVELGAI